MTETDLLKRCCESPADHLAESTISQFQAYILGYAIHTALEAEDFDRDAFTAVVKADYKVEGSWPYNVATTGFLVAAEGESAALSKYLDYRIRLAKPTGAPCQSHLGSDLFAILESKDAIRKRPGMYFGSEAAASHVWSMISGFGWAEVDSSTQPGMAGAFLVLFQEWVEQRFPFSRGIPWHRTLYFVSLSASNRSLSTFFDHFDLFRAGEPPECLSQAAQIIMKSIDDHCGCDPSGIEDTVRRIAPI